MPELYTYRCGNKLPLQKNPNQFVIRSLPGELKHHEFGELEQVSSASTRITISDKKLESIMIQCRGLAPTHHAYEYPDTGREFLITDRIFVRFKKEMSLEDINAFASKYHLIYLCQYNATNCLFQLTDHTGMNPVKLVVLLTEKDRSVRHAGHDLNRRATKYDSFIPSDPSYLRQWHLHDRLNDTEFDPISSSRCEEAWQLLGNYGDPDVVIAVTDDGCRMDHNDFDSTGKFTSWGYFNGQNLITMPDFQAREEDMYQSGSNHGTACAGVIAGEADAIKTVGAAPNCSLLPIKWESSGMSVFISDSKLITAIRHISDKADIMSNSWGSSPHGNYESQVLDLINLLSRTGGRRGKGIVFLWAAGNDNCPIDHVSNIDIPYGHGYQLINGSYRWVGPPTSKVFSHNLTTLDGVMYVAAIASTGQRSHYSNYGSGISISAPSSNSHTYFRMQVEGLGITTTTGEGSGVRDDFGGTSSATPLVAGIAGLIISANPDLWAHEVIEILKVTASKVLNFTRYPRTPSSAEDPDTSWDVSPVPPFDDGNFDDTGLAGGTWSPWFGHGKVDARAAMKEVFRRKPPQTGTTFFKLSKPMLNIPDRDATGIFDVISCNKTGKLRSISIDVDILHTYRGDLVLSIGSPSGTEVVLHDRNGGSADNLKRTFSIGNVPELDQLTSQRINGDWTLKVRDMAFADVGKLKAWSLTLKFGESKQIVIEEDPGITIPDDDPAGIERSLNVSKSGRIDQIEISVDITHTYIGDLVITLVSPRTGSFDLHNRQGGNRDNIIKTYTVADTSALQSLLGKSIRGTWRLKVSDHAGRDIGKLNHWKIKFKLK